MLVELYEVYSKGGTNCIGFLEENLAKDQTLIQPFDGPFKINIDITDDELESLQKR